MVKASRGEDFLDHGRLHSSQVKASLPTRISSTLTEYTISRWMWSKPPAARTSSSTADCTTPRSKLPHDEDFIDYGPNPYNVKTKLTVEETSLPDEYRKALEKVGSHVEKRGWGATKWDRGYTLLHWAARNGDLELCRFLMAAEGNRGKAGRGSDRACDHRDRKNNFQTAV